MDYICPPMIVMNVHAADLWTKLFVLLLSALSLYLFFIFDMQYGWSVMIAHKIAQASSNLMCLFAPAGRLKNMLLTRFFPNDWGMGCRVTKKCSGNSNALLPGRVRKKGTAMDSNTCAKARNWYGDNPGFGCIFQSKNFLQVRVCETSM